MHNQEGVSNPLRKLQTNQGLCKTLARPGSHIEVFLWGEKRQSPATDLHILRLKPYMLCSPRKFRLTGSLSCIKPCLKKQKTWKLGNYLQLHWCCNSKRRKWEDTQQFSLLYVQISYVVVHTIRKTMFPNFFYVLSKSIKQSH